MHAHTHTHTHRHTPHTYLWHGNLYYTENFTTYWIKLLQISGGDTSYTHSSMKAGRGSKWENNLNTWGCLLAFHSISRGPRPYWGVNGGGESPPFPHSLCAAQSCEASWIIQLLNPSQLLQLFSSVQFSHSVVSDTLWPHEPQHARPPCPSPTPGVYSNSRPSNRWCHPHHLILCHPLLLLPSIFPSIRVFSDESVLHISWPKYWSFTISPSNEYSGLISFRMDWLVLLAVQGTLKSLLQHHSSKASILWHSAFFIV